MANSGATAGDFSQRCGNQPAHQPSVFGRAKWDEALYRKFPGEHRLANMNLKTIAVVQATDTVGDDSKRQRGIRHEEDSDENAWLLGIAWDDVIGALLDPREVRKAQLKEVDYLHEKHVYTKISRAETQRHGIKILPTRWVDVNKRDAINTHHRSRFVAMEFITTKLDGLFASTPPGSIQALYFRCCHQG